MHLVCFVCLIWLTVSLFLIYCEFHRVTQNCKILVSGPSILAELKMRVSIKPGNSALIGLFAVGVDWLRIWPTECWIMIKGRPVSHNRLLKEVIDRAFFLPLGC